MTQTHIQSMASIIGGLVTQAKQVATEGRYAWPLYDNPNPDVMIPPAHCWRSVGKRTLSHPVSFATITFLVPFGGKIPYEGAIELMDLPITPLVDLDTTLTTQIAPFYDNNDQEDRGTVEDMVLIGLRAIMTVAYAGKQDVLLGGFRRSNEWAKAIPQFAEHYLSFRTTHTPSRRDPFVNDTPFSYINRQDSAFVAVPPLIWNTRDTTGEWVTRAPDFNPAGAVIPTLSQLAGGDSINIPITADLFVEGLFVPDPDRCDQEAWPGLWCPPQAIQGHREYDPDFYRHRRKRLGKVVDTLRGAAPPRLTKAQLGKLRERRRAGST